MLKLLILVALTVQCIAVPVDKDTAKDNTEKILQRPSPINPDVPSDPKPADKITKITDPKEISKYKRETDSQPQTPPETHLVPTIPPTNPDDKAHAEGPASTTAHNHREKRDTAQQSPSKPSQQKTPIQHKVESNKHRQKRMTPVASDVYQKPQTLPFYTQEHSAENSKDSHEVATNNQPKSNPVQKSRRKRQSPTPIPIQKIQTLPAFIPGPPPNAATAVPSTGIQQPAANYPKPHNLLVKVPPPTHLVAKRDIPVPLKAKLEHSEESSKEDDKTKSAEDKKDDSKEQSADDKQTKKDESHQHNIYIEDNTSTTTEHPVIRERPVSVAELFSRQH